MNVMNFIKYILSLFLFSTIEIEDFVTLWITRNYTDPYETYGCRLNELYHDA